MDSYNKKEKEPWRIALFVISIAFIVYTWVEKDILEIYATMPKEQIFPMIVTTLAVTLLKVAGIAGGILLVKWLAGKISGMSKCMQADNKSQSDTD